MVEFLQKKFSQTNHGVGFIYFDHKKILTPVEIIGSLLAQSLLGKGTLPNELCNLYSECQKKEIRPTFSDLTRILEIETRKLTNIFIVLDALDECPEKEDTRTKVLNALRSLHGLRLMVTGRPHISSVMAKLGEISQLEIHASDEDVGMYIEKRITSNENLIQLCRQNSNLREIIKSTVIKKASGR